MSKQVEQIKLAIGACERELTKLRKALTGAWKECFVKCTFCSRKSKLKNVILLDVQWYDINTGSPCGGYWRHSHWAWKCPKCENPTKGSRRGNVLDEKQCEEIPMSAFKTQHQVCER